MVKAVAHFMVHMMMSIAVAGAVADHFVPAAAQMSLGPGIIYAAMALGLVNACLPILFRRLTPRRWQLGFPLAAVLVNGAALVLAARVVPGVQIPNAGHAVVAVLVMAAVSYLVGLWGIVATSSPPESQRTSD